MKLKLKAITATALPVVAGAIAAKFAKNLAGKMIQDARLKAALPLVVGLMLTGSKKTEKIGMGMIAVGGADLAGSLIPALNGIEDMDLNGIFGNPLNSVLNGEDDEDVSGVFEDVGATDYDTY